jgi:hypothetical protein
MKKIYCLCACILLAGCEIIPQFNQCATPKFIETDVTTVQRYFLTEDLIAKFCPAETPKVLSYQVTPEIMLSVYQKEEWVYLKANNNSGRVNLYAKGLRLADFKSFTHVMPLNSLRGDTLSLIIDGKINYEVNFTTINCTCIN